MRSDLDCEICPRYDEIADKFGMSAAEREEMFAQQREDNAQARGIVAQMTPAEKEARRAQASAVEAERVAAEARRAARSAVPPPAINAALQAVKVDGGDRIDGLTIGLTSQGVTCGFPLGDGMFYLPTLSSESGGQLIPVPWHDVVSVTVDGPDPTYRVTKPRAAAFGLFSLAAKKRLDVAYLTVTADPIQPQLGFRTGARTSVFEIPGVSRFVLAGQLEPVTAWLERHPA